MGYRFKLNHGNIVVYLTTPAAEPPRVETEHLNEFLRVMREGLDRPWHRGGRILTQNRDWSRHLDVEAQLTLDTLERVVDEPMLPAELTQRLLRPLRKLLSQFRLYAMPLWTGWQRSEVDYLHHQSEGLALGAEDALVLFPDEGLEDDAPNTLDSLPAFDLALQHRNEWPGLLLWTHQGNAAFVPAHGIAEACESCLEALRKHDDLLLAKVVSALAADTENRPRRILHLSDLHFGSRHAAINAPFLEAELHDTIRDVDRVVITGDLFDNPTYRDLADYQRFSQEIHRTSGREAICIPGNHDVRWLGNLGSNSAPIAALRWSSHVVDDDISTVFFGFNSAEQGRLARGKVSQDQLQRMAAEHRNALTLRPELRSYLTIALVHHHPYSFETGPATLMQRMLAAVRFSDEPFLRMVDADRFTEWCARWGVSAVLHGHKHLPRYEIRTICPEGATPHKLPAIGCGSSLGAEGEPMSYGILSWSVATKRWSTAFFESRGGGPFVPRFITITRDAESADANE